MSKNMNIPKLRFKEFNGEWEEKKLGKIADISSGGTPLRNKPSYWNGTIPWVTTSLIDFRYICSAEEYITEEGLNNSSAKLFEKNTILMAMYGQGKTRGKVGVLKINATTNQACASINPKSIDYIFLYQYLMNQYDNIRNLSNEGGQKNLSASIIKNILIPYPSKQEQEKIASFLTSVDTKIEQLTKKETLLQEYKKGVMNKIFNQEIRFKDDDRREFPEWEEKKLVDLINLIVDNRGKTPPSSSDEIIPLIEVNAIGQKNIDYSKISKFVSEDTFNSWFRKYLQKGDVLFSTVGQTAICSFYDDEKKVVIAQNIVGLRFDIDNSEFMYYMLIELNNHRKIKSIEMGAVQPSIKVSQLTELFFNIPCIQEQTKIANFLSSIDKKIELTTKELNFTKEFKKALLQQMFV